MEKSPREKLRDITGIKNKLSEREMKVINNLCEINNTEGLVFAQSMESAINNISLNEKLLATALFNINNEGQSFIVHAIYCFFKELDFFYKNKRFDARNENACINSSKIIKVWDYNDTIDSALDKKAEETAKYWATMHRTLQQVLMRVFVQYIDQYNSSILTNTKLDPMFFI